MGVEVSYDYDFIKDATKGVDNLVQRIYKNRRTQIAQAFIDVCTPFVPVKTGALRESAQILDDGKAVKWSANNPKSGYDYAERQYYDASLQHPRGGIDHWDEAAMAYEGDTFMQRVEEILTR